MNDSNAEIDHIPEMVERLRRTFEGMSSESKGECLRLLDELEDQLRLGIPDGADRDLQSALGQTEQSLRQATRGVGGDDDLFHRAMHALESAIVDLETTLPVAAKLMKRMAGLISHIGL